ncbi:MAG: DNA primase DnaG [Fervidicoccaceae archaeon]
MKYLIRARIEIDGVVDKHDVIGALFGQTEGLLPELDLRELQEKGRVGRIQVDMNAEGGKVRGEIKVPCNLDRVEVALIAALLETIDKVGPYSARVQLIKILDLRLEKLKKALERAKEILRTWHFEEIPEMKELLRELQSSVKSAELVEFGPEKLPAGPALEKSDLIIIVEGRADVLNLLRCGYNNVVAVEGARGSVPDSLRELVKNKTVVAFVDGDHAGDLIARELISTLKVDFVTKAPQGKEVEELTCKEIARSLEKKIQAQQFLEGLEEKKAVKEVATTPTGPQQAAISIEIPQKVVEEAKGLAGTLESLIYGADWTLVKRVPVRDLHQELKASGEGTISAVIFDGIVTQRIIDVASEKKIPLIVGARIGSIEKRGEGITILTLQDLIAQ